ncbi:M48 family metallopeptidase [Lacrimispora sp. JR3]|uniref:M48 family metallopeptidase n=1 Tax=Lacrimispora sinapis TaxID=3111456 RepID=UPI00374A615E
MKTVYNDGENKTGQISFPDGSVCTYKIVPSNRRTMALQVTKEGEVLVKIPRYVSLAAGQGFILENKEWVYKQVSKVQKKLREKQEFSWKNGAVVLLFGKNILLSVIADTSARNCLIRKTDGKITITGPFDEHNREAYELGVREGMKLWYRKIARAYLEEKTAWWASHMGVAYEKIAIRDQATRWGSCSTRGNLNFNWRLVLLPAELADYVVVHELAHRLHMNHSREFWNVVGSVIPDYMERRKELKLWSEKLDLIY